MSKEKIKTKGLRNFFITSGIITFLVVLSLVLFLIPFIKWKIISYVENNSSYTLKINAVSFTGLHSLEIKDISFQPKLSLKQFYVDNTMERDWISLKTTFYIEGIDWKTLLWDKKMYAQKLSIIDADLYRFANENMPDGPYEYCPLHSQLLRNASFSMTFPLVQIVNGKIAVEDITDGGKPGTIFFTKLNGILSNLSTDSEYIAKQPEVKLEGKGLLLDSIEANIVYKFSTLNKKDFFTFEAHVGSFNAPIFNTCITPAAGIKIKSGHVEKVALFFQADDNLATGTLNIDYDDLKLEVFSMKHPSRKSFLKSLMVKKDDKKFNGKEKGAGKIYYTRIKSSTVFFYWWAAIRSGLLSSIVRTSNL